MTNQFLLWSARVLPASEQKLSHEEQKLSHELLTETSNKFEGTQVLSIGFRNKGGREFLFESFSGNHRSFSNYWAPFLDAPTSDTWE